MRWIILVLLVSSCTTLETPDLSRSVIYTATCTTGTMDITIEDKDGGTAQFNGVSSPWIYSFTSKYKTFVYVSAQNNQSIGTVTTEIKVNGKVWKNGTSSGAYVISTSSGSLE